MKKAQLAVCLSLLLLGSACNQEPKKTPEPAETTESPTPTPTPKPAFDLEGVVIEASGSADAQAASPSPGGTSTSSPTTTPTTAASPTGTGTPAAGDTSSPAATDGGPGDALIAIEQAAPGSIALKLTTYSSPDGSCDFGEGDTVVVAYTRVTTFEPPEVLSDAKFPNNLAKMKISVRGDILDPADNCLLVASSVTALEEVSTASPSPTKRAVRATPTRRPSPRPSPTPTTPSPTAPTTPATTPPTTPATTPPTTPAA